MYFRYTYIFHIRLIYLCMPINIGTSIILFLHKTHIITTGKSTSSSFRSTLVQISPSVALIVSKLNYPLVREEPFSFVVHVFFVFNIVDYIVDGVLVVVVQTPWRATSFATVLHLHRPSPRFLHKKIVTSFISIRSL